MRLNKETKPLGMKVLKCGLKINKFKLQSWYCIHFWTNALGKGINPLMLLVMG